MTQLTQAILHELLHYDPFTGALTWRKRARKWFKTNSNWKRWNTRFAGKPAFITTYGLSKGYWCGSIFGKPYLAHRIIILWMTGHWPNPEVDHINQKGSDNRWANLQEVTRRDNCRNTCLPRNNTSGRIGVYRCGRLFEARITIAYRQCHLGYFKTFEEASDAREAAEREHGFSENHGRRRLRPRRPWSTPAAVLQ